MQTQLQKKSGLDNLLEVISNKDNHPLETFINTYGMSNEAWNIRIDSNNIEEKCEYFALEMSKLILPFYNEANLHNERTRLAIQATKDYELQKITKEELNSIRLKITKETWSAVKTTISPHDFANKVEKLFIKIFSEM